MICVLLLFCSFIVQGDVAPDHSVQVAQFDAPAIVLLAHNYLDGRFFSDIEIGNYIHYETGGEWTDYKVVDIRTFEALQPDSIFTQLFDGLNVYSPQKIHEQIFNDPDTLVLQTCIYNNNRLNWGRLFVVAERQWQ